jgi:hypothetical protein
LITTLIGARRQPCCPHPVNESTAERRLDPQKLAIVAKRVAKVTITVKDALRREQELKRALEVDKTIDSAERGTASKIDRAAFRKDREAYWKKEAEGNPGKYSEADLPRMRKGRTPIGTDGTTSP